MDLKKIQCVEKQAVLTLIIANPKANTISSQVIEELSIALDLAEKEDGVTSVIITGEGEKFFSAGADLNEIAKFVLDDDLSVTERKNKAFEFSQRGQKLVLRLRHFPKPVTALINGVCVGGGFELALGCHQRLAVPHAIIGLPEVTLGIIPGWGGTYFLPKLSVERINGSSKPCREEERLLLLLENRFRIGICISSIISQGITLCSDTALKYGLIDGVIPGGIEAAMSSGSIKTISPFAVRSVIGLLKRHLLEEDETKALETEARMFSEVCVFKDAREGVGAFQQKRSPKFEA